MKLCTRAAVLVAGTIVLGCGGTASPRASDLPAIDSHSVPSSPAVSQPAIDTVPAGDSPAATEPAAVTPIAVGDPIFGAMIATMTADRPDLRFRFTPDRLDGDWRLDGTADNGTGAGRLFIAVTRKPGTVALNPCVDPDFVQGGQCVRTLLPGGDWIVRRGLVEANGTRTVVAALIHPDRSGIIAEASSFTITARTTNVSRANPLYTATELGELIVSIDRAIRALP